MIPIDETANDTVRVGGEGGGEAGPLTHLSIRKVRRVLKTYFVCTD